MLMELPFTNEQFFEVFERYNTDFPFAGTVLTATALAMVALLFVGTAGAARAIYLFLGLLWAWTGIVYHGLYFSIINPTAFVFGAMFILQSALFITTGLFSRSPVFSLRRDVQGILGACLILYALVAYPLIGIASGHEYPRAPTFGLPCPLTIFTFGMLLFASNRRRWYLIIIPTGWAVIGTSAAIFFGIWQDLALLVAAIIVIILLMMQNRRK